ncbi:beta-galactosidase [Dyella jiangningensis]|nr:beta-galactosidase [Dyella jiangningensis]
MKKRMNRLVAWAGVLALWAGAAQAAELPRVVRTQGASQLIVDGKPYVIFGGELGNSSAGTEAQADVILPRLAALHVNTVLMPVAWDQLEPREGSYDFRLLDHWIDVARAQHMHLVLLWFGSWKNSFSEYAPGWVKADVRRFPRVRGIDGAPLEILSTFGEETLRLDAKAFAALMAHLRAQDKQQIVLMVQVENEVGVLGERRDRSEPANRAFNADVPASLVQALQARRHAMTPELAAHFNPKGHTWKDVFGDAADEVFMAWRYATYIDAVAAAGKAQYALPMYLNVQLPAPQERAGEYPSGGSHPYFQQVYQAVASHIDFYSPDIYWPEFAYWVQRYQALGNPVFVPEARLEAGPYNALYLYGEARGFGFSPFDIDSLPAPGNDAASSPLLMQVYGELRDLGDMLPTAQADGRTRGLVLHATSPRPTQTVALGGYLFEGTLSRSWPARTLETQDGAMLVLQSSPDEFYLVGTGLTVNIRRDPDVDTRVAGIDSIEEVSRQGDTWQTLRRLNGDQSNQGRQLMMDPHNAHVYRVRVHAIER